MLISVETDEGIVGWGEGGQYGPPEPVAACIDHVLGPTLIGEDPRAPVTLWEKNYASVRDFGHQGPYIEAISAIDIALWDICGQALGLPVYALLGGAFRDSVATYATGGYYRGADHLDHRDNLAILGRDAESFVHAGFQVMKIKIGLLSIRDDMERIRSIRKVVGNDLVILVDCNHAYNTRTALTVGHMMEEYNVGWFEEPVVPENRQGYALLRRELNLAIAGGECEHTRYGFRDLFVDECVDIAQPDICVSGGFSEFMKILALASSFGVWVIPHVWGSGVALAAALHVLAVIPPFPHTANPIVLQNEPVMEYDQSKNPLRDDLLKSGIEFAGGRMKVPQGPGLGITIDHAMLKKFVEK